MVRTAAGSRNHVQHTTALAHVRAVVRYVEDLREAAVNQEVQPAAIGAGLGRDQLYEVPKREPRLTGLQLGRVQRLVQLLDMAPVGLGQVRVERDRGRDLRLLEPAVISARSASAAASLPFISAYSPIPSAIMSVRRSIRPVTLARALDLGPARLHRPARGLGGGAVLLDERLHEIRLKQPVSERVEHPVLESRCADRPRVAAGPGGPRGAAAPALCADHGEGSATDSAADQPRQEALSRRATQPAARSGARSAACMASQTP